MSSNIGLDLCFRCGFLAPSDSYVFLMWILEFLMQERGRKHRRYEEMCTLGLEMWEGVYLQIKRDLDIPVSLPTFHIDSVNLSMGSTPRPTLYPISALENVTIAIKRVPLSMRCSCLCIPSLPSNYSQSSSIQALLEGGAWPSWKKLGSLRPPRGCWQCTPHQSCAGW